MNIEVKKAMQVLENLFIGVDEHASKDAGAIVYEAVQNGEMPSGHLVERINLPNGEQAQVVYPKSVTVLSKKGLIAILKLKAEEG